MHMLFIAAATALLTAQPPAQKPLADMIFIPPIEAVLPEAPTTFDVRVQGPELNFSELDRRSAEYQKEERDNRVNADISLGQITAPKRDDPGHYYSRKGSGFGPTVTARF